MLFRVDREGKIFDVRVTPESPKEAAALLLWIFDVVHLPPPPPAAMRQGCCALSQTFNLGRPLTP
ncbi:hypothetical protein CQW49_19050 [Methylosinus trichosporium OB3b]|uniref:TonB C-terminal domain-containing protein n=1 Tax=Methylosinus trichosporium (strain ATCC 35070 / NCIMB 11131 / UNIQEM 75 / OB3b) TaxID=595536 RepID=A0A2D2D436_METT3|nr:hypothetical protein CQW49_19050 [Methylosinus trichosporium OB3b]OBS52454.1 hypothetical protein A8B73_11410 [Methylosinus sp. 3S-1]